MELEELERKYRELGEEIERIKSKPEEYWYIEITGANKNNSFEVCKVIDEEDLEIFTRQSNAFPTEIEAARMAERFNLELEISKFIKDNHGEVDWSNTISKYYIYYDHDNKILSVNDNQVYHTIGLPYFSTKKLAEQAIEIYGNRLKFAWGITDER